MQMAGSFRSRTLVLIAAASIAMATVVVSSVDRCCTYVNATWRELTDAFGFLVKWVVSGVPRRTADWLTWIRAARVKQLPLMHSMVKRRPTVSPRWRMCPSI
jgi:hypothetical protein